MLPSRSMMSGWWLYVVPNPSSCQSGGSRAAHDEADLAGAAPAGERGVRRLGHVGAAGRPGSARNIISPARRTRWTVAVVKLSPRAVLGLAPRSGAHG
jgi:hypothetical protein